MTQNARSWQLRFATTIFQLLQQASNHIAEADTIANVMAKPFPSTLTFQCEWQALHPPLSISQHRDGGVYSSPSLCLVCLPCRLKGRQLSITALLTNLYAGPGLNLRLHDHLWLVILITCIKSYKWIGGAMRLSPVIITRKAHKLWD